MSRNLRSALTAGLIALVIYVVIAVATGQGFRAAVGFGVILGLVTAVVSLAIYTLIARGKQRNVSTTPGWPGTSSGTGLSVGGMAR